MLHRLSSTLCNEYIRECLHAFSLLATIAFRSKAISQFERFLPKNMVWLGGVSLGEILRNKNSLTRVQKRQGQEIHGELDCYDESSHSPRLAILLLYFKPLQCTHKNKDNLKRWSKESARSRVGYANSFVHIHKTAMANGS